MSESKLLELIERVEAVSPRLVDHWQTMAIVESLGYTDRIIKAEFGFADVLEIGQYIYQQHHPPELTATVKTEDKPTLAQEILAFVEQFSRSFVYAIPLISLLVFSNVYDSGNFNSNFQFIPPQLGALFTLATLASLITSGGFVQAIARRGEFYLGLGMPQQARLACLSLLGLGMLTSFVLAIASLWFGFYRSLFADGYLVLGTGYYLILSLLWMLLAILSLLSIWGTPLTLIGLTVLFWGIKFQLNLGSLEAQVIAILVTLLVLAIAIVILFRKQQLAHLADSVITLPNLSATVYLLVPFFAYGITYFCFIFADRLMAGLAVDSASGLFFAIDSSYQRAMDLALLNFLLAVPLSEYLAYKIISFWYRQAKTMPFADTAVLSKKLHRSYLSLIAVVLLYFGLLTAIALAPIPKPWTTVNPALTTIGCLGYLLLVLGLLNAVILFNLNLASGAIAALFPSLLVNLGVGYLAANAIAPEWAVLGLVIGSLVFILLSRRKVLKAINHPDYAYYLGGY